MELRHLRYFLAIAQEGTVSGAARRLFVAQPALTRQLRELERHLGHQLFVRTARGVVLTEAGHKLLPRAQDLVDRADAIVPTLRADLAGADSVPRIGLNTDTLPRFAPYLETLVRKSGAIRPVLTHEVSVASLLRRLDQGELDLVVEWWVEPGREDTARQLFEEPMVAVMPERHELAALPRVSPTELGAAPLALFHSTLGPHTYEALTASVRGGEHDTEIRTVAQTPDTSAQATMVRLASEDGIATAVTAHNWNARLSTEGMVARPLDVAPAPISVVWSTAGRGAELGPALADAVTDLYDVRRRAGDGTAPSRGHSR